MKNLRFINRQFQVNVSLCERITQARRKRDSEFLQRLHFWVLQNLRKLNQGMEEAVKEI